MFFLEFLFGFLVVFNCLINRDDYCGHDEDNDDNECGHDEIFIFFHTMWLLVFCFLIPRYLMFSSDSFLF